MMIIWITIHNQITFLIKVETEINHRFPTEIVSGQLLPAPAKQLKPQRIGYHDTGIVQQPRPQPLAPPLVHWIQSKEVHGSGILY